MNNDRLIASEAVVQGCRDFVLLSDGKELDPTVQVLSITVNKKVNKVSTARIVVKDGSTCAETFEVSDGDYFAPGRKIEIRAGRGAASVLVFKGLVIKIKVKASNKGGQLTVECKDECLKMTIGKKNKYFKDKTDNEIIKKILDKYGLAGNIEPGTIKQSSVMQSNTSDWEFMLSRAASLGLLVVPDDGKINLIKPSDKGEPVISLVHGSTVVDFEAELDSKDQYPKVEAQGVSPTGLSTVTSSSSPLQELGNIAGEALAKVLGIESFGLRHGGQRKKEELQAWADSTMLKSRLAKVKGRAKFKGFGAVKPGDVVGLGGVGQRFAGNAIVTSTQQVFQPDSWTTTAEFGLDQGGWGGGAGGGSGGGSGSGLSNVLDQASELIKSVTGLRTGTVISSGATNIKVSIPIVGAIPGGGNARHAVLHAGRNRGSYWQPEPGDEVVLGFLNGDPREPVVLGSLYGGGSIPPTPMGGAPNRFKGFVTKSNLRVAFDDTKKVVVISTPDGNQLELNDTGNTVTLKDSKGNGNRIVLHNKGLTIESDKDITIKAKGKIHMESGQNCILESSKDFIAKGKDKTFMGAGSKGILLSSKKVEVKAQNVHLNPPKPAKKPKDEKAKKLPKKTASEGSGLS